MVSLGPLVSLHVVFKSFFFLQRFVFHFTSSHVFARLFVAGWMLGGFFAYIILESYYVCINNDIYVKGHFVKFFLATNQCTHAFLALLHLGEMAADHISGSSGSSVKDIGKDLSSLSILF